MRFRLIRTTELEQLRDRAALWAAHEQQMARMKADWERAVRENRGAKFLPPEPAPVVRVCGADCRDSYVTELEARLRRQQRQLDDAMGYDKATDLLLDAARTVPRPAEAER